METLKNTHYLIGFLAVKDSNPNGDPDMKNLPRVDNYTGQGLISDVAQKRAVRDYVMEHMQGKPGYEILECSGTVKNAIITEAKEGGGRDADGAREFMCKKYFDVRTFGAVLSTGGSGGCGKVWGPAQFTLARSIDPIHIQQMAITTQTVAAESQVKNSSTSTMGRKYAIPFGFYKFTVSVHKSRAEVSGFSEEDYKVLREAIVGMYSNRMSSSKGIIGVTHLWDCVPTGAASLSLWAIENAVTAKLKDPKIPARNVDDYEITVDTSGLRGAAFDRIV